MLSCLLQAAFYSGLSDAHLYFYFTIIILKSQALNINGILNIFSEKNLKKVLTFNKRCAIIISRKEEHLKGALHLS